MVLALFLIGPVARLGADEDGERRALLARRLAPFLTAPAEHAGQLGEYRSPLLRKDGTRVTASAEWIERRAEILAIWHRRLGPWPPLVETPDVRRLETTDRDGIVQHHVHVQISPEGQLILAETGGRRVSSTNAR